MRRRMSASVASGTLTLKGRTASPTVAPPPPLGCSVARSKASEEAVVAKPTAPAVAEAARKRLRVVDGNSEGMTDLLVRIAHSRELRRRERMLGGSVRWL